MEIRNWVTEDEGLAALNMVPPSPSRYARFLEKYSAGSGNAPPNVEGLATLRNWADATRQKVITPRAGYVLNYLANAPTLVPPSASPGRGWKVPPTISREKTRPIRTALTSAHLRTYVDAWLDTGRRADGSEWLGERNVRRAFDANLALWDYLEKAPPTWSMSMDSSGVQLTIAAPSGYNGVARDFFEAQIVQAKRLFVGMMMSNWKDRLCKCRYSRCGRYFSHPKPRKSYKLGTFCCHEHAKSALAEVSMRKSRTEGLKQLIEAAARRLLASRIAGPQWQENSDRKRYLAEELCLVIARKRLQRYQQAVKVNWVTRHQALIEQKRVELANGSAPGSSRPSNRATLSPSSTYD
jgi:hypothetical protein